MSRSLTDAKGGTLRLAELYVSRQGEGLLTGTDSVFVRISGCNLRCWFCDTPYASWHPEGDQQSIDHIVDEILKKKRHHVVVTGGEPMLHRGIVPLCEQLSAAGLHVTMETAGTVIQPVFCDLMSISPKLTGSGPRPNTTSKKWMLQHESRRWNVEVVGELLSRASDFQLKFVVDEPGELEEVESMIGQIDRNVDDNKVWIMPQSRSDAELDRHEVWLRPWCESRGFRYCDRLHIRWYGNCRGT
ncbi:MAG: 7-carboxy-7-deazaguanine synthase QueE [Pirellulaceae bacterium]